MQRLRWTWTRAFHRHIACWSHCLAQWNVWCISNWHKLLHSFPLSLHFTRNQEEEKIKNSSNEEKRTVSGVLKINSRLPTVSIRSFYRRTIKQTLLPFCEKKCAALDSMTLFVHLLDGHSQTFSSSWKSLTFHPLLSYWLPFCVIDFPYYYRFRANNEALLNVRRRKNFLRYCFPPTQMVEAPSMGKHSGFGENILLRNCCCCNLWYFFSFLREICIHIGERFCIKYQLTTKWESLKKVNPAFSNYFLIKQNLTNK